MAALTLSRRTPSLRSPLRFSISQSPSPSSSSSISSHLPSKSQIPRFSRPFRRESLRILSSMIPIHSAIASARLVSKLPADSNDCILGNQVNFKMEHSPLKKRVFYIENRMLIERGPIEDERGHQSIEEERLKDLERLGRFANYLSPI